nr:ricin B lectin-like protein [Nosema bombycis]
MIMLYYVLSFLTARKVKITSSDSPSYLMMILPNLKGGSVRMMKEENVKNVNEQGIFEIDGETTKLKNDKTSICTKIFGPDIVTCRRNLSKDTFFHIINIANDVKFETPDNKCLSISEYDLKNKGYCLKLENCEDTPQQMFKMIDVIENESTLPIHKKHTNDISKDLYHKSISNDIHLKIHLVSNFNYLYTLI